MHAHLILNNNAMYFQFLKPVFDAIDDGDIEKLRIQANPENINRSIGGKTALFHAASLKDREALAEVEFLCSVKGIDVNKGDTSRVAPLTEAVRNNRANVVQVLLKHPNIDINRMSDSGATPLSEAVKLRHGNIIKLLCNEDGIDVQHKDWGTAERQNEMFESPILYPLLLRMAMKGCQQFDLKKCNKGGENLLHMAVLADQDQGIDYFYHREDVDFEAKNHEGNTAFDLIFSNDAEIDEKRFKSIVQIAHRMKDSKRVMQRKDKEGRTVLNFALELQDDKQTHDIRIEEMVLDFLTRPSIDIDILHNKRGILYILKDIVSQKNPEKKGMDFIRNKCLSESIVPDEPVIKIAFSLKKMFGPADDEEPILAKIHKEIDGNECASDVKSIYIILLNIIIIGLKQYANHRHLQYIFYKGSVFETFVKIFVDLDSGGSEDNNMEQLLRVLYISTQANIKCDFVEKAYGTISNHLRSVLTEPGLYEKFHDRISEIAQINQKNRKVSDAQLIAKGIYDANFKELEPGCLQNLKNNARASYDGLSLSMGMKKLYHKCFCRGDFAILLCLTSIFVQSSDIITDALVGFKTLNGFSERLGILMIALVLITLVHENISSVISAYDTDRELLCITLGKIDLDPKDYKENSELNYYEDYNLFHKGLARFFWTFKVKVNTPGSEPNSISMKALIFNMLSILMLRPVVDRLIVLTHSPSHLRAIFRQRSKQMSLNQYYMILEQMPELLIQFYVFQIYFNNLRTSDEYEHYKCTEFHSFSYKTEYFECVQNLMKLKICASWLEIYSMLVPFIKIPSSMVSLEDMFRTLHPETPNMSSATSWSLYFAYTLMIPSRLFLFAAVMHSAPNHLYVAPYIGTVTCVWLAINVCTTVRQANVYTGKKTFDGGKDVTLGYVLKTTWSLLLFTIRDVVVISLRRPDAYLMSPSEVNYRTLRSWKTVLKISSYFFVEGVVGAWYVEHYYPCGRNTEIFKYQGWFYLILLILSITTISLVSYVLQPTKINIIAKQYPIRAGMFCLIGFAMWSITVVSFLFTTTNSIAYVRLPLIIITLTVLFIMLSIVALLRFFSEAKQKGSKEKDPGPSKMSTDENLHGPRAKLAHYLCCKQKEDSSEEPEKVRFALPLRTSNQYTRIASNTADIQDDINATSASNYATQVPFGKVEGWTYDL